MIHTLLWDKTEEWPIWDLVLSNLTEFLLLRFIGTWDLGGILHNPLTAIPVSAWIWKPCTAAVWWGSLQLCQMWSPVKNEKMPHRTSVRHKTLITLKGIIAKVGCYTKSEVWLPGFATFLWLCARCRVQVALVIRPAEPGFDPAIPSQLAGWPRIYYKCITCPHSHPDWLPPWMGVCHSGSWYGS